jgi:hypothetical protein
MKISINNLGAEFSANIADDCTLEQVMIALKGLLVAAGFHPVSVDNEVIPNDWAISEVFSNEHS